MKRPFLRAWVALVCVATLVGTSEIVAGQGRGRRGPEFVAQGTSSKKPAKSKSKRPSKTKPGSKSSASSFDWPCFRGPHGNGTSDETGLLHTFSQSGPKVVWKAKLGTGFSGVSIAGGRAFTLYGLDGRERIVCFDALSGEEQWNVDSDADFAEGRCYGPRSTPCVDGDRVYAVGASGRILCLSAAKGEEIWSFNVYKKFKMRSHEEGLSPSPLVLENRLIIYAGRSVFALDKSTGEVIWQALDEPMNHASPTIVQIEGGDQLLVLSQSNLIAISPRDGHELWRHENQAVNIATPIADGENQIFTGAAYGFGSQLVRVKGSQAQQVYKNEALASHTCTPILYQGKLYGCHDRIGTLRCVDMQTGKQIWESRTPGKSNFILAEGQLIMLTEAGELVLAPASPDGFEATASAQVVEGISYTQPSLAHGKLYVRSDQELACIEMKK